LAEWFLATPKHGGMVFGTPLRLADKLLDLPQSGGRHLGASNGKRNPFWDWRNPKRACGKLLGAPRVLRKTFGSSKSGPENSSSICFSAENSETKKVGLKPKNAPKNVFQTKKRGLKPKKSWFETIPKPFEKLRKNIKICGILPGAPEVLRKTFGSS